MSAKLRVRINVTVEIDVNDWCDAYGTRRISEVRNDVKCAAVSALAQAPIPMRTVAER